MYRRVRFYFRFIKAFVAKHYLPLLLGITVAVLSFFTLPKLLLAIPQFRTTQHIGLVGRYTISDLPSGILSKIGIGLTVISKDLEPGPGLAKSWTISEDGKTVTFDLNTNLSWQDGSTIVSSDIKYVFKDAEISYPTSSQIVFKLQDPYSPLPALVSRPVFKTVTNLNRHKIIGTGSYAIKSYTQNGKLLDTLTLAPTKTANQLPYITYHFYASPQQARTAFKLGFLHEISDLPDPQDLSTWPNAEIISVVQKDRYVAALFNTDDPFFAGAEGKNLRLALAYATTKPTEDRASGPIPDTSWAYFPDTKKYATDLTRAKELLKSVKQLPSKITILTLPAYFDSAEGLKRDWEQLGLSVEILSQPDIVSGFQVSLVAQAIPVDPDQYIFWHSTQEATNLTRIKNPRVDKLLEDGRKTWDFDARKKIYQDFQKYLVEEVPAIFLYHPTSYTVIRK